MTPSEREISGGLMPERHYDNLGNPTAAHTRDALEAERDGQRQRERYTCAVPTCHRQIDLPRYVFCLDHWHRLPADVQRRLWEGFSWPAHYGKEPPRRDFAAAKQDALTLLARQNEHDGRTNTSTDSKGRRS